MSDDRVEPWRRRASLWRFTRRGAMRARRRWLKEAPGRDSYLRRRGRFHWEVSRIERAGRG
jgi:hypothetical protein